MSAQHTPGPWAWDFRVSVKAGGRLVALVYSTQTNEDGETNLDDNCRLIAAAPELLLALQSLMNLFEQHEQRAHTKSPVGDYARAAIAKATGDAA